MILYCFCPGFSGEPVSRQVAQDAVKTEEIIEEEEEAISPKKKDKKKKKKKRKSESLDLKGLFL